MFLSKFFLANKSRSVGGDDFCGLLIRKFSVQRLLASSGVPYLDEPLPIERGEAHFVGMLTILASRHILQIGTLIVQAITVFVVNLHSQWTRTNKALRDQLVNKLRDLLARFFKEVNHPVSLSTLADARLQFSEAENGPVGADKVSGVIAAFHLDVSDSICGHGQMVTHTWTAIAVP